MQQENDKKRRLFDLTYGLAGLVVIVAGYLYINESKNLGSLQAYSLLLPALSFIIFIVQMYVTKSQPLEIRNLQRRIVFFGLILSSLSPIYIANVPLIFVSGLALTVMALVQLAAWQLIFNRKP